ncbi:MAG: hypothetical protein V1830_04890 [Candidatus Omnitrophota bacterium]
MNFKRMVILSGLVVAMMAAAQIALAQEAPVAPSDSAVITSDQPGIPQKESDMQWAWGEVTNLDNQAGTVTLKYLDYETDQEKELVLVVDEKTVFENIKDFNALKLNDTLSIDYIVGTENRNIAKNISFETPEDTSSAPVAAVENNQPVTTPSSVSEQPVVKAAEPVVSPKEPASVESAPAPVVEPAPAPVEPPAAPVEPAAPVVQGQTQ